MRQIAKITWIKQLKKEKSQNVTNIEVGCITCYGKTLSNSVKYFQILSFYVNLSTADDLRQYYFFSKLPKSK